MRAAAVLTALGLAADALAGTVPSAASTSAKVAAGAAIYARCAACHALAYDRTGPHHCGLFGRRAGSVPGFAYSDAMRRSGIVWDARTLDRFLSGPDRMVPNTTMTYAGVPDARERAALIAWLKEASRGPECR
jgi:cytochrome c